MNNTNGISLGPVEERKQVYRAISDHFGGVVATKVKNEGNFSVYYANVSASCLLCLEDRYLVIVTRIDDHPLGQMKPLTELNWISFQTRTIDISPRKEMRSQSYHANVGGPAESSMIINDSIEKIFSKEDRDCYVSKKFPLMIELLYTEFNTSYADRGTIKTALQTFNCVLKLMI